MQKQGSIRRWNADKGFGFIQGAHSSDVFFHIRDFGGGTPAQGMQVTYEEIQVGGKGPRAMQVRPLAACAPSPARKLPTQRPRPSTSGQRPPPTAPAGTGLAILLMLAWLALLAYGSWAQRLPLWLLGVLLGLNLLTFLAYALDKSAARQGNWRTPEIKLHLLALLGGWPAAWWAQQWLRHKSNKEEFRSTYWVTLLFNCAVLGVWVLRPGLL